MAHSILLALAIDRLKLVVGLAAVACPLAPREMQKLASAAQSQRQRLPENDDADDDQVLDELLERVGWTSAPQAG
jgi:hypothetical protein